jgi:hypothetical protein
MSVESLDPEGQVWAIVLAGGQGNRLRPLIPTAGVDMERLGNPGTGHYQSAEGGGSRRPGFGNQSS